MDFDYRAESWNASTGALTAWFDGLATLVQQRHAYWRAVGKASPGACQFEISELGTWCLQVDAEGAQLQQQMHPSPTVRFVSSPEGLRSILTGKLSKEHPVFVHGDFEYLKRILGALTP